MPAILTAGIFVINLMVEPEGFVLPLYFPDIQYFIMAKFLTHRNTHQFFEYRLIANLIHQRYKMFN
jgi:hypothetical protein